MTGKAVLVLEDGRVFTGREFGAVGQTLGDVETSGRAGFVIVAVKKKDGSTTRGTDPETRLAVSDLDKPEVFKTQTPEGKAARDAMWTEVKAS